MTYQITSKDFEGPISLLLALITSHKIELFDLSLSQIVDEYLAAISDIDKTDLEVSTEFLTVAATLIGLKARRLLPRYGDEEEESELSNADERELLLIRLIEAAMFKGVSSMLSSKMQASLSSAPRTLGPEPYQLEALPDPLEGVHPDTLRDILVGLLSDIEGEVVDSSHITVTPISSRDVGEKLLKSLNSGEPQTFRSAVEFAQSRYEVIVCFLLLLEAFRLGLVDLVGEEEVVVRSPKLAEIEGKSRFEEMTGEFS